MDSSLYIQVLNTLRDQIMKGQYPEGSKLPSESELIETFGVSRGPVRQAMGILENEGIIERVKGSGAYVRQATVNAPNGNGIDKHIGLILSEQGDQLNMEILIGTEQAAKSRGYRLSVSFSHVDPEQQRRDIQLMQEDGINGLIIFPIGENAENEGIAEIVRSGEIPIVLVDRYFPHIDTNYVVADNFAGGYRATEHLLILGHRQIGFVYTNASTINITSLNQRLAGYRAALDDYGLEYDESLIHQRSESDDYEALFAKTPVPDAIFAASDIEALLVLRAAQQNHISIPDEIAIVSFDNLTFSEFSSPPLTTVSQPRIDIGLHAGNMLIDRIEHKRTATKQVILPTNLIVRESCGAKTKIKESIKNED